MRLWPTACAPLRGPRTYEIGPKHRVLSGAHFAPIVFDASRRIAVGDIKGQRVAVKVHPVSRDLNVCRVVSAEIAFDQSRAHLMAVPRHETQETCDRNRAKGFENQLLARYRLLLVGEGE